MRTITASSKAVSRTIPPGALLRWSVLPLIGCLFAGCVKAPTAVDFFTLTPQSAGYRAMQTRMFETADEKNLLSASAAVLQDLGFQVEEGTTDV